MDENWGLPRCLVYAQMNDKWQKRGLSPGLQNGCPILPLLPFMEYNRIYKKTDGERHIYKTGRSGCPNSGFSFASHLQREPALSKISPHLQNPKFGQLQDVFSDTVSNKTFFTG